MHTQAQSEQRDDRPVEDHVVFLHGLSFEDYERLLDMRGDCSAPRISYLEGEVEIMSPSSTHESLKSLIGRLVEAFCLRRGIRFHTVGSWTLKAADRSRAAEPDECYVFGDPPPSLDHTRPHLAIEVIWTSGRIDKLDIYRKLGIAEVWYWRRGRIQPYALRGDRYEPVAASAVLPGLDLELLTRHLDAPTTFDAIRAFAADLDADVSGGDPAP